MEKLEPSAEAQAAFEAVVADLAGAGAVRGNTFGAPAVMLNKKAIACLHGDAMAFKLGRDSADLAEALTFDGAAPFDPSGLGRPFKDWARVPVGSSAEWARLAEAALRTAGSA